MAIGSVIDLIDYERRTIEIAKKYGGGGGTGDFKKTDMAPTWSSALVYDRGDIVLYEDKFYFALIDNFVQEPGMNPASMEYWFELGTIDEALGYMREDLKEYTDDKVASFDLSLIADEYDETHLYPANDMVVYNKKLYRAISDVNTPGRFNETMWNTVANYNIGLTYNTGDYAVKQVEGLNRCFRCDENNVTGEWDASKWTDVSETDFPAYTYNSGTYYPNYSKVSITMANPQLEPPTWTDYYIANSTYAPTGGAGEWNSEKWTETTVETVLNKQKVKSIQICSLSDVRTDANGFLTNSLTLPATSYAPLGFTATGMQAMGSTLLVDCIGGIVSGVSNSKKFRAYDATGTPIASSTGFSDMGGVVMNYLEVG